MILVAGCSFIHVSQVTWFSDEYTTKAFSGASNEYIAHQVIESVYSQPVDYVFVLFTGITRIDISVGPSLKQVVDPNYYFQDTVGNQHWIFSGGFFGTWSTMISNKSLKDQFALSYKEPEMRYYTDRTAYHVLSVYNALKMLDIPFDMGFIYDPLDPQANDEQALGTMDSKSSLFQSLPWDEFIPTYPYNWCKERNMLSEDGFHPTDEGLQLWRDSLSLKR